MMKVHNKQSKKYILMVYTLTNGLAFSCGESAKIQQEKYFYKYNPYTLPKYTLKECNEIILDTKPDSIDKLTQKRIEQWCSTGKEPQPYTLLEAYIKEDLTELLTAYPFLKNYYAQLIQVLKEPTEENKKKIKTTIQQFQDNTEAKEAYLKHIMKPYMHPDQATFTKQQLAYQECWAYLLDRDYPAKRLHQTVRIQHTHLVTWKNNGHPSGLVLWQRIKPLYSQHEQFSNIAPDPEDKETIEQAIEDSLRLMDNLTDSPYGLSYEQYCATLPQGFDHLDRILNDLPCSLKENKDAKLLKTYYTRVYRKEFRQLRYESDL